MPIELRCSRCDTLLRVPDGSGGRETRCPSCQAVVRIPAPPAPVERAASQAADLTGAAGAGASVPSRSDEQEANPFAAPTTEPQTIGTGTSPVQSDGSQFKGPPRLLLGEVLATALRLYGRNFMPVLGGAMVTTWLPALLVLAFFLAVTGTMEPEFGVIPYMMFVAVIPSFVLSAWLYTGMMQMSLHAGRGGVAKFTELFSTGGELLSVLLASFLLFILFIVIAMGSGFVASFAMMAGMRNQGFMEASIILQMSVMLVLGVLFGVLLSQSFWLIVDRKAGPWSAFGRSIKATAGFRLKLLVLVIASMLAFLIVGLIPLLSIVLQPLLMGYLLLLWACVYLGLTDEPMVKYGVPVPSTEAVPARIFPEEPSPRE